LGTLNLGMGTIMIVADIECTSREQVQDLISRLWDPNHILTRDNQLLDWQHKNENGNYSFCVVSHPKYGDCGLLGYVPATHWDKGLQFDVWFGAIWAADARVPGAGLFALRELISHAPERRFNAIGISQSAAKIYARLNLPMTNLRHQFLPGGEFKATDWGSTTDLDPLDPILDVDYKVRKLDASQLESVWNPFWTENYRTRSANSIQTRYLNHPTYRYQAHAVESPTGLSLLIWRMVENERGKVLRIIDILRSPNDTETLRLAIKDILDEYGASFADYYCIDEVGSGPWGSSPLLDVSNFKDLVIPNFFSPYEARNIELVCASTYGIEYVSRGDGDQDRPS